ncbi:MAG: hypothetical protein QOE15_1106 [Acidimicrobiaceae bacterium]|nr:hypothetical protein [Acidimicrobiaceae bacterium]
MRSNPATTSIETESGTPARCPDDPEANWATRLWPEPEPGPVAPRPELVAALAAPLFLLPEWPLPVVAALVAPTADPDASPVLPKAPVTLDPEEVPRGADPAAPVPAEPDAPPAPLEPVAARPDAPVDPEAARPVAEAEPDAGPEAPLPVEPDDWLEVWVAGPEGPDEPPAPLPAVLLDVGLELAGPLVPPDALAPVVDPPDEPDDALPVELPVEPPLDPPVDVPVAGPLLPLPAAVPVPLPDDVLVTAAGAGWGAGAAVGPLFSTATNARLSISPTTAAKVGDRGCPGNRCGPSAPFGYPKHRSAIRRRSASRSTVGFPKHRSASRSTGRLPEAPVGYPNPTCPLRAAPPPIPRRRCARRHTTSPPSQPDLL